MAGRLTVWGGGTLGGRIAGAWVRAGGEAVAVTASPRRHAALAAAGVTPRLVEEADGAKLVEAADALLLCLPGHARQLEAVRMLASTGLAPRRAVLTSSTGAYGDGRSGRIDERSPPGEDARAAAVAATERAFHAWMAQAGTEGVVLRLGGLYCSGRGPYAALVRRGSPPLGPPDRTLALVHYDDAAAATVRALVHPHPEPCYLVVAAPCPSRRAFYRAACARAGLPPPRFAPPVDVPRVDYDTARMRRDLVKSLRFPNWTAALT